ncbi:MAG: TolB family protein [Kofleriaceae bacterium]
MFLSLVLVACGGTSGDDGPDGGDPLAGLTSLTVKPADQTLVIAQSQAATSTYTALGTFADGRVEDVSAHVQFSLADATLGTFAAADFTSSTWRGGATRVLAFGNGVQGETGITLRLEQQWNDPASNLPSDPAGAFGGPADPSRAPGLVYPNDGVVLPPNLGQLELHFRPGAGNTLFEVRFYNAVLDLKVYLRCTQPLGGGCIYQPDAQVWRWLAETNRGSAPVNWTVRGTDDAGTGVGTSTEMDLRFSPEDVTGGIYYWTTTSQAIMRFDFASATQTTAETFFGSEMTGGTCVGCHALSRDGTKLVAESGGQNDGRLLLLDVATKTPMVPFGSTTKSIFESWNHDGSAFVGVYGDTGATNFDLMVFDGTTGAVTETIAAGGSSTNPTDHPDWSPAGDRIAFVNVGVKNTLQMFYNGEIRTVAKSGGAWGPPQVLVPRAPGKNRYYPAFAPDGTMLVFDESTCNSGNVGGECNADTDPSAKLYVIDGVAGGAITALDRANGPGVADGGRTDLTNSFPKWNPTVWQRDLGGGRLAWLTFSSTRQYGLRSPPGAGTLLWMVAVDLDAPAGTDPSAAAFALPFQDLATSNHIAQWTTKVVEPVE